MEQPLAPATKALNHNPTGTPEREFDAAKLRRTEVCCVPFLINRNYAI